MQHLSNKIYFSIEIKKHKCLKIPGIYMYNIYLKKFFSSISYKKNDYRCFELDTDSIILKII